MKAIHRSLSSVSAASQLAAVAFGIAGLAIAASGPSSSATKETISIVFHEDFDDDELGAVPIGAESIGSVPIENNFGTVEGVKSSAAALLNVVREDSSDVGNCLAIGDLDPAPGGALASFVPARGMVGVPLGVSFTLRRESSSSDSALYLCAIDNRTTPGTGRLLAFGLTGIDGDLEIGGQPQPFALKSGATYRFDLAIDLETGGDDSWGIAIQNLHDPFDHFEAKGMRTLIDGEAFSAFVVSASSEEGMFAYVDDFEIVQYLDNG